MRYLLHAQLIAILASGTVTGQETAVPARDVGCIVRSALDYLEGTLTADPDRVARGAESDLIPLRVHVLRDGESVLSREPSPASLRSATNLRSPASPVEVVVFDGDPVVASARASTGKGIHLLQLAKLDGKWRIVGVLWSGSDSVTAGPPNTADSTAIAALVLEYREARRLGDRERARHTLHPEAIGLAIGRDPATGEGSLAWIAARELVEPGRPAAGPAGGPRRNVAVTVFDVTHGMAAARLATAEEVEHLQLAKLDGRWQIVAVLRAPQGEPSGTVS